MIKFLHLDKSREVRIIPTFFFPVLLCPHFNIKNTAYPVIYGSIVLCINARCIQKHNKGLPVLLFLGIIIVNQINNTGKQYFCRLFKKLIAASVIFCWSRCFHQNSSNAHNIWFITDIAKRIKMNAHRHSILRFHVHNHDFISIILKILPCLLIKFSFGIGRQEISAKLWQ